MCPSPPPPPILTCSCAPHQCTSLLVPSPSSLASWTCTSMSEPVRKMVIGRVGGDEDDGEAPPPFACATAATAVPLLLQVEAGRAELARGVPGRVGGWVSGRLVGQLVD